MNNDSLNVFYGTLKTKLELAKKYKHGSCLISLAFEMLSNKRNDFIKSACVKKNQMSVTDLNNLLDLGFIRKSSEAEKYEITAQGIWEIEKDDLTDEAKLVDYLDHKYFYVKEKDLNDKERVIITAMIAGRAFSKETPLDLLYDICIDSWKELLDQTYHFLRDLGVLTTKPDVWAKNWEKKGNEHPVSDMIRHTDQLPKKVNRIFKAPGKQQYFLDVSRETEIKEENLTYLFRKLFGDKMTIQTIDAIMDFCKEKAMNAATLYEQNNVYVRSDYDYVIEQAVQMAMLPV